MTEETTGRGDPKRVRRTSTRLMLVALVWVVAGCAGQGSDTPAGTGSPTGTAEPSPEASPEIGEARLEGAFSVEVEVTAVKKVDAAEGDTATREYVFTPTCAEGPCDTDVERETSAGTSSESLTFDGGVYTFEGSTDSEDPNCGGEVVVNAVSYDLHVTDAEEIDGEWRATAFEADMVITYTPSPEAIEAGCSAGQGRLAQEARGTLEA